MTRKKRSPSRTDASPDTAAHAGDPTARQSEPSARDILPFPIVGVGASAGGIGALKKLLRALPADTGMALVLVQHLDPTHESMLSEILGRETGLPVQRAKTDTPVQPNHVYVLPAGQNMSIASGVLKLSPRQETGGTHRPIDNFLRALARDRQHKAIGVVLSGTGSDGTLGLEDIKAENGITFAQDRSAEYEGMPQSAIAAGCVDFVLDPAAIAAELARIARHPYVAGEPAHSGAARVAPELNVSPVIEVLHRVTGVNFSGYKPNTLARRTARRMLLQKMNGLDQYLGLLHDQPHEVQALFSDLLISVTSFFRDPEAFEAIKQRVFAPLAHNRGRGDPIRVWVVGCSTGEEAYSLAIAYAEFIESAAWSVPLQLFATDLNGASIDKARTGIYSKSIAADVTPERLRRFFTEVDGSYQIKRPVRDACVFARHNSLAEPPFSRIDLLSCRNMLIYLDTPAQQKIIHTLHYALKPGGYLWLGNSESIGAYRDYFDSIDSPHKIYAKKPRAKLPANLLVARPGLESERGRAPAAAAREALVRLNDPHREADRVLLSRYAPPGVLVNAELDVLQYRGETGLYLAPAPGRASLNLLKMLRDGLGAGAKDALEQARRDGKPVRKQGLRVRSNGGYRAVDLEVIPLEGNAGDGAFLVLFDEPSAKRRAAGGGPAKSRAPRSKAGQYEDELEQLRNELAASREHLHSVIEQQEAANEELQSANEEVQSANEELQSVNEELETSKEEIESSNEELATVNEELNNRNLELAKANSDLANLLDGVQLAIVMLGPDLRIRRFTPHAERLLHLIPADLGRPLSDIRHGFEIPDLQQTIKSVISTATPVEFEVRDNDGHWYLLRVRPYRTAENNIEGVLLVLIDVDSLKVSQGALLRLNDLLEQTHEPVMAWDIKGIITYWNAGAEKTYGYSRDYAIGQVVHELLKSSIPLESIRQALRTHGAWTGEIVRTGRDGEKIVVESRMVMDQRASAEAWVLETDTAITERKYLEQTLRERAEELAQADRSKNEFLAMLAHELRNPLAPLRSSLDVLKGSSTNPATVEHLREIMDRQVTSMTRMVDDLLDVARITQHQILLRMEPLDLGELLERTVELVRNRSEGHDRTISLALADVPVYVRGDPIRIEQVFTNILLNAVKFTGPGGRIEVSVALQPRAPGADAGAREPRVAVRIRDNGIGIPGEALPRVFDLFAQVNPSLDRMRGGLGIGLTLVRRVVELHGGQISAQSTGVGQGSEFTVRLPTIAPALAQAAIAQQTARPALATIPSRTRKILIVDDNQDAADSAAMLLRFEHHQVEVAYSGQSALQRAPDFIPDVAFIDISLPDMDGFEIARRMRKLLQSANTKFVALSGYGEQAAQQTAQSPFDAYLTKPVDITQLLEIVAGSAPPRKA